MPTPEPPPDPLESLPSEEQVRRLPRWARVAYAARCARRVQALFALNWKDAFANYVQAVGDAIALAEAAARVGRANFAACKDAAWFASSASTDADSFTCGSAGAASMAADAASWAAFIAADAADDARADFLGTYTAADATRAYYAARQACFAAHNWLDSTVPAINACMQSDYELLSRFSQDRGWTDSSPVDIALLGPLWPNGRPVGWPDEAVAS